MDINKHTNAHTIPFVYGAKYTAANNTQYPFIAQMYGSEHSVRRRGRFITPVLQANPNGFDMSK